MDNTVLTFKTLTLKMIYNNGSYTEDL